MNSELIVITFVIVVIINIVIVIPAMTFSINIKYFLFSHCMPSIHCIRWYPQFILPSIYSSIVLLTKTQTSHVTQIFKIILLISSLSYVEFVIHIHIWLSWFQEDTVFLKLFVQFQNLKLKLQWNCKSYVYVFVKDDNQLWTNIIKIIKSTKNNIENN